MNIPVLMFIVILIWLMLEMLKKANFPTKICLSCYRPFAWRKKWKAVWDDVKYCSDACRKHRNKNPGEMLSK